MVQQTDNLNKTGKMMKELFKAGQVLSRSAMKKVKAGSSSGCGPSCSGCIPDNSSSGYNCVEWICLEGQWCYPKGSDCCIDPVVSN